MAERSLVEQVLRGRLARLTDAVRSADRRHRGGDPEAVHDLRVAMRRMRSLLASGRPLLDGTAGEQLRQELRWAGAGMGGLRDLQVVHERLLRLLAEERVEVVLGQVERRIEDYVAATGPDAEREVAGLLASERYAALLGDVGAMAERPFARHVTVVDAQQLLAKDWRRLRRLARAAPGVDTEERAREAALHDVRKAAKRARYAAETWEPLFGHDARLMAEAGRRVQQTLGDHRDTLLTRPVLRRLAVQAHRDGENSFTLGHLHAREQAIGAAALDAYERAAARVERRKLRRWLR